MDPATFMGLLEQTLSGAEAPRRAAEVGAAPPSMPLAQGSGEYTHIRGHIRMRLLRSIFGGPNMTPNLENIVIFVGIFVCGF